MKTLEMMFGGGANVAELADMIRRFGRGEDKILAHITPEEAAMLKEQGGSGTINPMTGLPEFQEDYYGRLLASESDGEYTQSRGGAMQSPQTDYRAEMLAAEPVDYYGTSQTGFNEATEREFLKQPMTERNLYDARLQRGADNQNLPSFEYTGGYQPAYEYNLPFTRAGREARDIGLGQRSFLPSDSEYEMALAERAASDPSFRPDVQATDENIFRRGERGLEELNALLNRYPNLSRIGGAGVKVIGQALLSRRANRQRAAQAQQQRERAVPFRAAEAEAMERARGGGLTPQDARRLEAQQARARQGLGAANQGAGSAAAGILAGQEQRTRSVARQESFDEALKQAGIADEYERRAIAAELAADKEMAALFSKILSNEISAATSTEAAPRRP
jgi:hypothetical protein